MSEAEEAGAGAQSSLLDDQFRMLDSAAFDLSLLDDQFRMLDSAAFDPSDTHTGWCTQTVVQHSDSGISAVHLPKVFTAFETVAEVTAKYSLHVAEQMRHLHVAEGYNAKRFEIVLWVDPLVYLEATPMNPEEFRLLIHIPENCPVLMTTNVHGTKFIVLLLGDTDSIVCSYSKCDTTHIKHFIIFPEEYSELRPKSCYTRVTLDQSIYTQDTGVGNGKLISVLVEEKCILGMPVDVECIVVAYTGDDIFIAVQTNTHAKKKMQKAPDWSLVFSVPRKDVTIAKKFSATAFLTGEWYVSAASYTTEQLYELLPYTHKLPKSVDFILPADIWRTDDEQQVTGAPVHAAASGAASRAASGARNQAAAVAQNARGGADAVKTEQQKAVRQAIAMLESKSPPDPLKAAVKATEQAKKAVKKAQKIVLISTWARFLATIRSRKSEQKKNDFRDQRRRINLWFLLVRIRTLMLSRFWKMLRALRMVRALKKTGVHWLCFIRELKEKRLEQMVAEHRKEVTRQNVLWRYFCTQMLVLENREGRKVSDMVLKALLRNRSTRIRKLQASLSATAKAAGADAAAAADEIRKLQASLSATAKAAGDDAAKADADILSLQRVLAATTKAASDEAARIDLEIPRCIICLDEKPNIVMLCPSNHQLLCAGCFASEFPELPPLVQIATPQLCPVCRQPFEGHLRVHLP